MPLLLKPLSMSLIVAENSFPLLFSLPLQTALRVLRVTVCTQGCVKLYPYWGALTSLDLEETYTDKYG